MTMTDHDVFSFGALLQTFRKRQRLTQQGLAEAIRVHRRTLVRWEQGDYLPESKALVLELARHLKLNDQETRRLLEASLTALSPYWFVPFSRNPYFTGREEILEALHTHLCTNQIAALTQSYALHGLGGVGKTQIALEYAYQYALEYSAVFWIGAETSESILSSLLHMARELQLPNCDDNDQQRVIAAVQRWLMKHNQWLLIWDNLEGLDLLLRFLPSARQGAILLTTRSQALGTLAQSVELAPMKPEEGRLLLLRRAKVLGPEAPDEQMRRFAMGKPNEYASAEELVTVLGSLPLALDQAGAYIEETGCGLSGYLRCYEQQRTRLLDRRGNAGANHPQSVVAIFVLAMERVEREQRAAADILRVSAFLHAEAIPEELFVEGAAHLGPELSCLVTDLSQFDQMIAAVRRLSLVQRQAEARTLSIHRLVQAVLRERISEQERVVWLKRVIAALSAVFPEVNYQTWKKCERLLPHALTIAAFVPDQAKDQALAKVLRRAADYLYARAQYEEAEPLYKRSLHILEHALGPEHADLAAPLNGLAFLYREQGKYEKAELLYKQVLSILEQARGPGHTDLAAPLNGLALLYFRQGKYKEVEPLYRRSLHILEQALGPEHPDLARPLSGLADLYQEQQKYEEAKLLYEQALPILEQALGPAHPDLATLLSGLADLYSNQRNYKQAELLYKRALSILEQILGPEHPHVAYTLNNLADLYQKQGRDKQAELLYEQVLSILEQALGPEHPHVATLLNELADLYSNQRKDEQAELFYERAQHIMELHQGQHHPETARGLAGLARLYERQNRDEQAEMLLQRACTIFEQSLGQAHTETVKAWKAYHSLLERKSKAMQTLLEEPQAGVNPFQMSEPQNSLASDRPSGDIPVASAQEVDPLADFLTACCELHPRAWCRISGLWQAYELWVEEHHERFPLSRRAFAAQLKAHSCEVDRTSTARIWRGITLVDLQTMTKNDKK
jgi:DNA-binding XRE family transcriptional regulator